MLFSSIYAQNLVFGVPPYKNSQLIYHNHSKMVKELESKLNKKIKITIYDTREELVNDFLNNKIDFAHFGAFLYVQIPKNKITPIVQLLTQDGSTSLTCTIFSNKKIENLETLTYLTLATTSAKSICGDYFIHKLFKSKNINSSNINIIYAKSHKNVVLKVMLGEAQSGSVETTTFNNLKHLKLYPLVQSDKYPSDLLVASNRMNKSDIAKIQDFFINLDVKDRDKSLIKQWCDEFSYGMVLPDINSLEKLKKELELIN